MRYQVQLATALLAQGALAFPAMDIPVQKRQNDNISGNTVTDPAQALGLFDAKAQFVSNSGEHEWRAPTASDARGPCPGLNAMANHGYIPRNGVATTSQFIAGTNTVFGMGRDLGGFLSILGAAVDGDLQKWSIGGVHPSVPGGTGLTGSHNKYECDVSPGRGDLYQYGNNFEVQMSQFSELYNMQAGVSDAESNYNLKVLQDFRSNRFDQSIANNPYFFNGPFSGVAVQPAAYTFIYRFMGNKSAEHPEGQLTKSTLKSFFGMTENEDGSFSGGTGFERIPDNWYKRNQAAEYSIPFFTLDLGSMARAHPKFLSIGGNTGTTNTFTGVNPEDLTGGLFNLRTLGQGNNAFCFAYQFVAQAKPDILTALLSNILGDTARSLLALGCPQLARADTENLKKFPGYARSGGI